MIHFNDLALSDNIMQALSLIQIEYVFQPIFKSDGKTIFAREALMRPKDTTVTELIAQYQEMDQLHIIEVATFFGAMQAYMLRGYSERVAINSFPSDCMSDEEANVFWEYYGDDIRGRMIIEVLEYPSFSLKHWIVKNESVRTMDNLISLDDYGSGINDMGKVKLMAPDIVKLDRSLISGIDRDVDKQIHCKEQIDKLHEKNVMVVAEGIETKEEFDYLVSLGADLFQGYYLGRPV